jgi:6-hydroxycyclohex-1-ene-1-carbonyl-CoA dehydrogenase
MVKALGAGTVIAVDIVEARLQNMLKYGADFVINAAGKDSRAVAADVKRLRDKIGLPGFGWKIFEAAGNKSGQDTALNLLSYTGKLIIVGFAMTKVEYAMGRLMVFDAEIIGTWGCLPEYYPQVLEMVTSGRIALSPFVQTRPMSWIRKVFEETHKTPPDQRLILTTDDMGLDDSPEPKSCR